jgi:hypothetical protein
MADWIRMRSGLVTNPRVTKMARILLADREFLDWLCPGCDVPVTRDEAITKRHIPVVARVVVGALLPVWSMVNDTAASDGIVRHATSRDIDETAGVPGFGRAMIEVEWLDDLPNGEGVQFVNFEEHNSPHKERAPSAKTGAQRSKEYRERKAAEKAAASQDSDNERDGKRDVTKTSRDVTRDPRGEGRGGDKKNKKEPNGSSSAGKLPPCPNDAIVAIYHEVLPELPGVKLMPKARKTALQRTWHWVLTSKRADHTPRATNADEALAWFREYFARARDNDFLMGRTPRSGEHANWRCDLDFLLTDKGMRHVIEKTGETA